MPRDDAETRKRRRKAIRESPITIALADALRSDFRDAGIYRLYGGGDDLLYIGQTVSLAERLAAHRRTQPWWPEVAVVTFEPMGSERVVLEYAAIRAERPRYNRHGVPAGAR